MRPTLRSFQLSLAAGLALGTALTAQTAPVSGTRPARLIIRNATVVDGNGTPAKGPYDIVVENNVITQMAALDPVALGRNGGQSAHQGGRQHRRDRRDRQVRDCRG